MCEILAEGVTCVVVSHNVDFVRRVAGRALIEVSGGINLGTVRAYAEAGVDLISSGALTHSAPCADLSLEVDLQVG